MEFRMHDLHLHSQLSLCSGDPAMNPQTILAHAEKNNYAALCLTDHLWDSDVPGSSDWYAIQDIEHVRQSLPLPASDKVPFLFGCETELPANGVPALAKEHFDLFDFVVIPPNHMHMNGLVRKEGLNTPEKMAEEIQTRLEILLEQDFPFDKIGIAHLDCGLMYREGSPLDVIRAMSEARLLRIFQAYAQAGTGIELNVSCFKELDTRPEDALLIFRIAKEAGCKFYTASDAHHPAELSLIQTVAPKVVSMLGLEEKDRYIPPVLR